MYQKVLVPLDGSPLAEAVLPHAKILAESKNAEIVLLRVAVDPAAEFAFTDPGLAAQVVGEMKSEARSYMDSVRTQLHRENFRATMLIREGPIAETILAVAQEVGANIIAMSTHGRTGASRWLLGSIAERVVHHARVPVLLVRPEQS